AADRPGRERLPSALVRSEPFKLGDRAGEQQRRLSFVPREPDRFNSEWFDAGVQESAGQLRRRRSLAEPEDDALDREPANCVGRSARTVAELVEHGDGGAGGGALLEPQP